MLSHHNDERTRREPGVEPPYLHPTMNWLNSRLNRKFGLGTAAGLLLSSLVFLVLYIGLYRNELTAERTKTAEQVNTLLRTSLENAMLKRDLEGLRYIVDQLSQQPGIASVFITNPTGEVRFASPPALLGRQHPPATAGESAVTLFLNDPSGRDILRAVTPVANRPACRECHGPVETHPINGILYVDYDAAPIRHQARATTLLLMGSGAIIVLLNIAGGWWFLRRHVIKPVEQLTTASLALAEGDLATRTLASGNDELAELGRSFNAMAEQLQSKVHELAQQGAFLQNLVDAIPDGVRVIAPDYQVLLTNRAYREQLRLGDSDGVGQTCHLISHQSQQPCPATLITCPVHELGKSDQPVRTVHRHHRTDGRVLDVEIYASPLQTTLQGREQTLVVESIRDLTKQIKYSQEQKLSELGKLATGVAHEIYNPLASVKIALHALQNDTDCSDQESEVQGYLQLVDREVDKCIAMTEKLLRLGMPPPEEPQLVNLATVIEDTLSLVRWEADEIGIRLDTQLDPGARALASDSELRMVALNLIQNAFHAMPQGGELRVIVRSAQGRLEIEFHDTGVGIPPERLNQIFDPFYSRRANGTAGTGLGLSIVRSIVTHYGGKISVASDIGRGSVFVVTLPDPERRTGDAG